MAMPQRHCQECAAPIPAERVEALPDTTLCVRCSDLLNEDFDFAPQPKKVGKKKRRTQRDVEPVEVD